MTETGDGVAPRRAFLALGSNLGDRLGQLRSAVAAMPDVVAVSPLYETDPVGGPPDQESYLNAVVELFTARTARQLLALAGQLEEAAGRVRVERWGSRTLDVDVLWIDGETVSEDDLEVPHPRMWERDFVLVPLADLDPGLGAAAAGGSGPPEPPRWSAGEPLPEGIRPAGSL